MKKFLIDHIVSLSIGGIFLLSAAGAIWYLASNRTPSFSAVIAGRGNVIASLNEPAAVLAENNANLSFQAAGQIAHIYAKEGDTVSAGTVLADLGTASLQAGVQQAQAALAAAQAKLGALQAGTRPEQLMIDETAVANAQSALTADIGNAYASADDAIHNQTDNLFTNPKSNNPIFLVPLSDSQTVNDIESSRLALETMFGSWYAALNGSSSAPTALVTITNSALNRVQSYLDMLALPVNDATANSVMTASILAGYKTDVATARTEVGAAITTVTGAESALATAQSTLTLAQAGSTSQDIAAQQATVLQAQAALTAAQVALNNSSLVAPFAGTVQNLTAQIGQVVSPGVPVLALVNNSGLKIQTYVSEADVAKIKSGDSAQITLDAFGAGTMFPATITTVDTAESQVNGTPAYLVTLHFAKSEPQIKDGMTGNARIILAEDDNVVEVPSNLVINNNSSYFVLIQSPAGPQQRQVTIGLTGDNGMTEITSGVNAGDQLANF